MSDFVSTQDFETLRAVLDKALDLIAELDKRITQLEEAKAIRESQEEIDFWEGYERRERGDT